MKNGTISRDIWFYMTAFIAFSFIGWMFETAAVLIFKGSFTFRGYLFEGPPLGEIIPVLSQTQFAHIPTAWGLPLIEMYGIGGIIVLIMFPESGQNFIKVFLVGMIILTIFEYFGSLFCEYVIGKVYWDYSGKFLNFQGRVCLSSSLAWGFLAVFATNYLEPAIEKYYLLFNKRVHFHCVTILILFTMGLLASYKYL